MLSVVSTFVIDLVSPLLQTYNDLTNFMISLLTPVCYHTSADLFGSLKIDSMSDKNVRITSRVVMECLQTAE